MKQLHLTGKLACALIATVAVISGCQKKEPATPPVEATPAPTTTPAPATTPPATTTDNPNALTQTAAGHHRAAATDQPLPAPLPGCGHWPWRGTALVGTLADHLQRAGQRIVCRYADADAGLEVRRVVAAIDFGHGGADAFRRAHA
jgi:hypothetical protein